MRVMFLCKVALGSACNTPAHARALPPQTLDAHVAEDGAGAGGEAHAVEGHSVEERCEVVLRGDAALPCYLVVYKLV